MKKLFLFLFASLLSVSIFAENETGKTKADAIPYNWKTGIVVTSEPNVGKWYVVNLDKSNGGIFYDKEYIQAWNDTCAEANRIDIKKVGKTVQGNTDANITVVNPLNKKVEVDITAYIAANEYEHHYTLQADEAKSMNLGAGMLVKMGNYKVYLYLVMDVEITPAQAAAMDAVHVNINEAPANSVAFVPDTFNWTGFGPTTPSEGNIIPANKEVWLYVDWNSNLNTGYTLKLHAQTTNGAATTVYGGLAMDCPATSIQEQSTELSANEIASKTLDPAMLDMVPGAVYVRLQANQPLHVWATEVTEASVLPKEPVFNTTGATKIEKNQTYTLTGTSSDKYYVTYETLTDVPEYHYIQVELTNNSGDEVTLNGKAAKNANGDVYSVMSHDVTIGAHQTLKKEIDNSILSNLTTNDKVYALVTGGNENISFQLVQVCTEKDPCDPANAELVTIPATGEVSRAQTANTTKWYKVAVKAAKTAQTDIRMTLEADDEVTFNVDIAAGCAIGEPTQSYNGTSSSSSYTIGYALFENAGDTLYVRVNCNKDMTVKAELIAVSDDIVWNGSEWSNGIGPKKDKPAYIDGPLTINGGKIIEAEDLYIRIGGSITIKAGGALFVGKSGIKNATSAAIVVEDGGMLLISPEASATYSKPLVEAHKTLHLGEQVEYNRASTDPYKATLPDLHEFITVPVIQPEDLNARCLSWDRVAGWKNKKKTAEFGPEVACEPFIGYNIYTKYGEANYRDYDAVFRGQLASNKNQSFGTSQIGWYAFGNAWFAPIKLQYLLAALDEAYQTTGSTGEANQKAVHTYVTSPMDIQGLDETVIKDNYYIPLTAEIAANVGISEIKPMQGFFLFTEEGCNISVDYTKVWNDATGYGTTPNAAPKHNRVADDRNKAAVVLRGGNNSDFVYLIEGEATNASKMVDANLAIYAKNNLVQVASDNLIGTILTIKTNNATEYTLSFGWLNGETMYLRDLQNGVLIEMTEDNKYTFTAEPNTVSERFQVVGRNDAPTAIENTFIEGANKVLENGKVVIIKNGVKYNVLGAQL